MNDEQEQKRVAQQQEFERKRLAERGRTDPERGKTDPERGKTDPERGKTDPERGMGLGDFPPERVAADIFRGAASLGGHLVVAFVAPVSASSRNSRSRPANGFSTAEGLAAAAQAEWADNLERIRQQRKKKAAAPQPETAGSDEAPARTARDTSKKPWSAGT
jgi:hypothetical protein